MSHPTDSRPSRFPWISEREIQAQHPDKFDRNDQDEWDRRAEEEEALEEAYPPAIEPWSNPGNATTTDRRNA